MPAARAAQARPRNLDPAQLTLAVPPTGIDAPPEGRHARRSARSGGGSINGPLGTNAQVSAAGSQPYVQVSPIGWASHGPAQRRGDITLSRRPLVARSSSAIPAVGQNGAGNPRSRLTAGRPRLRAQATSARAALAVVRSRPTGARPRRSFPNPRRSSGALQQLANQLVPRDHGLPASTVHVAIGLTRPAGPTLQVNSRPDCRRPVHVHHTWPFGEQLTLWTVNPSVLAIKRA